MPLHWLFPTPVLQVDLEPDAATAAAMVNQLEIFDREVFQHPEFSERCNLTGDLLGRAGLDQLHRLDAFQWLNSELASHVSTYLLDLLGPDHGLSVHVQKAWPVVCASGGGTIELHSHRNAQLSGVFYLRTEADSESGALEFQAPDDYFSHVMAIPYEEAAASGGVFSPLPHRLLLFPSDLRHRVLPHKGTISRYSVSYDLAITTAPGEGREMRVPHPLDWVPLTM